MSKAASERKHKRSHNERGHLAPPQPADALTEAFCQALRTRGWDALVRSITALVVEGVPADDAELVAEYSRADAWLRGWISEGQP
jgi:hypothetical protein